MDTRHLNSFRVILWAVLNKTLKSSVGEYLVDKDRVERADVMLKLLFDYVDAGCTVQTEVKVEWSRISHGNTILVFISDDILGCTIHNSI
jgi:hypothetical protein